MSDFIAKLNYHSHVEVDDYGHSLTPLRQICRAWCRAGLASWCETFCAAAEVTQEENAMIDYALTFAPLQQRHERTIDSLTS